MFVKFAEKYINCSKVIYIHHVGRSIRLQLSNNYCLAENFQNDDEANERLMEVINAINGVAVDKGKLKKLPESKL